MTSSYAKKLLLLVTILLISTFSFSQSKHYQIVWNNCINKFPCDFKNAEYLTISASLVIPFCVFSEVTGNTQYDVTLTNEIYEKIECSPDYLSLIKDLKKIEYYNLNEDLKNRLKIKVIPYRVINQTVERLVSFDLILKNKGTVSQKLLKKGNKTNSILAEGTFYKIKIKDDGAYKIDKKFFSKNSINTDNIDLSTFKIFGNGGTMLPEPISYQRTDDLAENSLYISDLNGNNKFDNEDYILFYGKGPDSWDIENENYIHKKNTYSDFGYYFITWGGLTGKRMQETSDGNGITPQITITESDYLYVNDNDEINFRNSGREWFGESLTIDNKTFEINISDVISNPFNSLKSEVATRTAIPTFTNLYLNDTLLLNHYANSVNFDTDDYYASISTKNSLLNSNFPIKLKYEFFRPQLSSECWLNYFEIKVKRKMKTVNGQIHLFNIESVVNKKVKYSIESLSPQHFLWDVSDINNVSFQKTYDDNGKSSFTVNPNNKLLKFLSFISGSEMTPEFVGKVENQNLHSLLPADYIILTHPDFKQQAEKIGEFHKEQNGYTYIIAYPEKIYNEFSSGAVDITAIRDFIKMLYDRADNQHKPKALLLLGDASYDYKNKLGKGGNFVPTMESYESINSVSSYCSDDYFVILDDNAGFWPKLNVQENLDMGIGRLPAKSVYDAEVYVDKIIHYKTASTKGDWRVNFTFLGDDEDEEVHFKDSETLAALTETEYNKSNINKIYLDAFKQISLGNGNSYPDVNETINNSISKGTILFNYFGHGGGSGMAHERVVTIPQIMSWKNYDKLTFFITGTCDLAQYDNPKEESPGELMMINNEGAAIGMMTTTRKVYIGVNTRFSLNLYQNNLLKFDGKNHTTFGESYRIVKNRMWNEYNVRNYVMLGDPMLSLNLPKMNTKITKINSKNIQNNNSDTLKALAKVEIEGIVTNLNDSLLSNFNGDVTIVLFDKKQVFKTLANDINSTVQTFTVRNNVLYRGKASVKSGIFKVQFIIPKDIDYSIGKGRIFSYAYNDNQDACGIYDSIVVGGTSSLIAKDDKGPEIEIFLEDENFVDGGLVNNNPKLIVKLWDENGINTAGNGVGREILASIDYEKSSKKNYILNDFYSTTLDSYQGGEVNFNIQQISSGKHTLKIRAWDVYNNSSEKSIEFEVSSNQNLSINNLLNYPNPFVSNTQIMFDHNKAGKDLDISINIMTISGKIVKTIYKKITNAPSHIDNIDWNGKDNYGQNLARGVYLYKIKIKSDDGNTEELLQKMVLIK